MFNGLIKNKKDNMNKSNQNVILLLEACLDHEENEVNKNLALMFTPTSKQTEYLQFVRQLINSQRTKIMHMKELGYLNTTLKRIPHMKTIKADSPL